MNILIFTKHSVPIIEFFNKFLPSDSQRHRRRGVYEWNYGIMHCAIYETQNLRDNFRGMRADMVYADQEFLFNAGVYECLLLMTHSTSTIFPIERLWEHDYYDYHKEIVCDTKHYLETIIRKGNRDRLYSSIFYSSVTGNFSTDGYSSNANILQYLSSNLPLSLDAYRACKNSFKVEITPRILDVAIRCYLLRDCLDEIFDEYKI